MTRIVIIGGGFGGITVARELAAKGGNYEIILISKKPYFTYIPSIHEVVSGKSSKETITFPLEESLEQFGVQFLCDTVHSIDVKKKIVRCKEDIPFDYLVLALGSVTNFFNIPTENAFIHQLKSIDDAILIRRRIAQILATKETGNIHVIGGGPTGVELAAEIADTIHDLGKDISVSIIERDTSPLSGCSEDIQHYASYYLARRGVQLYTGTSVSKIEGENIHTEWGTLRTDMVIWTAGIQSPKLVSEMGLPHRRGAMIVTPYLHSPASPYIFGVGDNIFYQDPKTKRIAISTAKKAIEAGEIAARNVHNMIVGEPLYPWRLKKNPFLISLGEDHGIFSKEGWRDFYLSGILPSKVKKAVERHFLWQHT